MITQSNKKKEYTLSNYIVRKELDKISKAFAEGVNIPCSIYECKISNGDLELDHPKETYSYCEFCKLINDNDKGKEKCYQNTNELASAIYNSLSKNQEPRYWHECHAGLIDIAVPIYVGRKILAFFVGGQRCLDTYINKEENCVDEIKKKIKKVAQETGISEQKLMSNYPTASIVKTDWLDKISQMMSIIAKQISELAFDVKRFDVVSVCVEKMKSLLAPPETADQILESAIEIADCHRATLWYFDPLEKKLWDPVRTGVDKKELTRLKQTLSLGEELAGKAAKDKRSHWYTGISDDENSETTAYAEGMKSEGAVPILIGEEKALLGVLTVKSKLTGDWPEGVKKSLRFFADVSAWVMSHRVLDSAIEAVVESLDKRDPKNAEHSRRVAEHMMAISKQIYGTRDTWLNSKEYSNEEKNKWQKFGIEEVRNSRYVGLLHDVGKVGMPDDVLQAIKKFTTEDRLYRKIHPHMSVTIVEQIEGLNKDIVRAISEHHERFKGDGGYLHKIEGDTITCLGAILGTADAYDSMKRSRGSWRGFSKLGAYAQLLRLRGTKCEPLVVDAFLKTDEFKQIKNLFKVKCILCKSPNLPVLFESSDDTKIRARYISESYACLILHHELGEGMFGQEKVEIEEDLIEFLEMGKYRSYQNDATKEILKKISEAVKQNLWWCDKECKFDMATVTETVFGSITGSRTSMNLSDRAREANLAFLHIHWDPGYSIEGDIYEAIDTEAFKKKLLPIAIQDGVGILVLRCSKIQAYEIAEGFHKVISKAYKKLEKEGNNTKKPKSINSNPAIGISYVPSKDIIGCKCIIGSALVAS